LCIIVLTHAIYSHIPQSKKIEKIEAFEAAKPGASDSIFVVTERLPLTVSKNAATGKLSFEWLRFVRYVARWCDVDALLCICRALESIYKALECCLSGSGP